MNPTIGEMRERVEFQQNQPINNASGGQDDNFVTLLSCRGKLRQRSGTKKLEQGEIMIDTGWDLFVRSQVALNINLNFDTRVLVNGDVYRVNQWLLIDQLKHFYKFDIAKF